MLIELYLEKKMKRLEQNRFLDESTVNFNEMYLEQFTLQTRPIYGDSTSKDSAHPFLKDRKRSLHLLKKMVAKTSS
jgi:hypothetical protein